MIWVNSVTQISMNPIAVKPPPHLQYYKVYLVLVKSSEIDCDTF